MKRISSLLVAVSFLAFTACNNDVKVAGATDKDSINKAQVQAAVKAD